MTSPPKLSTKARLKNSSGQVVVEYILLLSALVLIGALITRTMVSRDPDSPGFLISKWVKIVEVIGSDSGE